MVQLTQLVDRNAILGRYLGQRVATLNLMILPLGQLRLAVAARLAPATVLGIYGIAVAHHILSFKVRLGSKEGGTKLALISLKKKKRKKHF